MAPAPAAATVAAGWRVNAAEMGRLAFVPRGRHGRTSRRMLGGENAPFWHYFTHCIMESDHHSQRVKMLASLVRVRYNIKKLHLNHVVWFLFTK